MARIDGFTLIEILLVMALMAIAGGGMFVLDRTLTAGNFVRLAGESTATALRAAQARAAAMAGDDDWTVRVASRSVTVFEGTSYAGRDVSEDRIVEFPGPLTVSGTTDIVFTKGGMLPAAVASLSLQTGSDRWYVRVNASGLVSHGPY